MRTTARLLITGAISLPFATQAALAQGQQLTPGEQVNAAMQQETIAGIEKLIADAEAARLAGDCVNFRDKINLARRDLDRSTYDMVPVTTHGELSTQIREVERRVCQSPPGPVDPGPSMPVQPINISLPAGYGVAERLAVGAWSFTESTRVPRVNYGFLRTGPSGSADEQPGGRSARNIGIYGFGGTVILPDIGQFTAGYSTGSERTSVDVGVLGSGGASGIINTAESPSGSTGVTGNFGLLGETRTSIDEFGFGYRRNFKSSPVRATPGDLTSFQIFVALESQFGRRAHDASLRMSGTTGGGFQFEVNQLLDQRVNSLRLGGSVGAEVVIPLAPRIAIRLGGEAGIHYYNFDLRSIETRTQNIGPSSDHSFENRIEDERSGAGWRGALWGGIAIGLSDRVSIGLTGSVHHFSHAAHVVNPATGDAVLAGETSRLATDDLFSWRISMELRMELAARGSLSR